MTRLGKVSFFEDWDPYGIRHSYAMKKSIYHRHSREVSDQIQFPIRCSCRFFMRRQNSQNYSKQY